MTDEKAPAATPATPDELERLLDKHTAAAFANLREEGHDLDHEKCWPAIWNEMAALVAEVRRARAAPAPGTATREEFERLVTALVTQAYLAGRIGATKDEATSGNYAALLRYEERLRGERDRAQAWENSHYIVQIDEARAHAEEATARVERLMITLEEIRAMTALGLPGSIYADIYKMAKAALGVPTSAADARCPNGCGPAPGACHPGMCGCEGACDNPACHAPLRR